MKYIWTKRLFLLLTFVLFDYSATLTFIKSINEEANALARASMEFFGIPLGLTLFCIMTSIPLLLILLFSKFLIISKQDSSPSIVLLVIDFSFAWFVAGLHFMGAISWFWDIPTLLSQALGASLYLFVLYMLGRIVYSAESPEFSN